MKKDCKPKGWSSGLYFSKLSSNQYCLPSGAPPIDARVHVHAVRRPTMHAIMHFVNAILGCNIRNSPDRLARGCTAYLLIRSLAHFFGVSFELNNAYHDSGCYFLAALLLSASVLSSRLLQYCSSSQALQALLAGKRTSQNAFKPIIVSAQPGFVRGQRSAKCCTCCF